MPWHAHLSLAYRRDGDRTVLHDRHDGPLRVLKSLYPEGGAVCHNVLVHPPAGIVGGDRIACDIDVGQGAHALITTPGATRFYRSLGETASQRVTARVGPEARLEWLPLETLAYSGCLGETNLAFDLAQDAEMIGWDLLALGLPAAGQDFESGRITQQIALPGRWLERGCTAAADRRLLDSPLGWAGRRVLACMWFASGSVLAPARGERLVDTARETLDLHEADVLGGVTPTHDGVIVLRALAHRVEPAMRALTAVWSRWRMQAWNLPGNVPRVWRT
jgi:urease accessory protein